MKFYLQRSDSVPLFENRNCLRINGMAFYLWTKTSPLIKSMWPTSVAKRGPENRYQNHENKGGLVDKNTFKCKYKTIYLGLLLSHPGFEVKHPLHFSGFLSINTPYFQDFNSDFNSDSSFGDDFWQSTCIWKRNIVCNWLTHRSGQLPFISRFWNDGTPLHFMNFINTYDIPHISRAHSTPILILHSFLELIWDHFSRYVNENSYKELKRWLGQSPLMSISLFWNVGSFK